MKILTIGNSFANNATMYLDQLIAPYPDIELILGKINLGGCSLEKHWNLVAQCDLLKDVKPYNFQVTGKDPRPATLVEGLVSEHWDYVTLQQSSILSWRPETFFPYIGHLHELITQLAPQAQPIIHQTWAYRTDATIFDELKMIASNMIFTKADHPRADHLPGAVDVPNAIELALKTSSQKDVLLITGSIFVASEARQYLTENMLCTS